VIEVHFRTYCSGSDSCHGTIFFRSTHDTWVVVKPMNLIRVAVQNWVILLHKSIANHLRGWGLNCFRYCHLYNITNKIGYLQFTNTKLLSKSKTNKHGLLFTNTRQKLNHHWPSIQSTDKINSLMGMHQSENFTLTSNERSQYFHVTILNSGFWLDVRVKLFYTNDAYPSNPKTNVLNLNNSYDLT